MRGSDPLESIGENIQLYGLIFVRVLGLFMTAPVLGTPSITTRLRIALTLILAAILYPGSVNYLPELAEGFWPWAMEAIAQAGIGVITGFFITIIFTSFQIIGEVLSIQMGISFSEVLDPQSQVSVPLMGTLKNAIGILLFLGVPFQMDGLSMPAFLHMIRALSWSFQFVPTLVFDVQTTGGLLAWMDQAFAFMFVTAIKIGIPMVGILFISSLTLGVLGRAAPQMNLINMGIQINIMIGLLILITLIPVITPLMQDTFVVLFEKLAQMFSEWPRPLASL
ncbi:MAG: flagellar biosynthetic protein FliR [Leptospiraceae bacterium]|nr:flagellar biosynthetic protein FliR [Leptospiraceae bacterium]